MDIRKSSDWVKLSLWVHEQNHEIISKEQTEQRKGESLSLRFFEREKVLIDEGKDKERPES